VLLPVAGWATRKLNVPVIDLDPNVVAFYEMLPELAQDHAHHWVVIHEGKPVGFYSAREDAVEMVAIRFGHAACLIRQVDAPEWVRGQPVFGAVPRCATMR
jgi:hypothetical protein